jgi:putative endonuclease
VTNNLRKRIYDHKKKFVPGFTKKYNVTKLVYYETYDDVYNTLNREKQIKAGSRMKKIKLINDFNPGWNDLYYNL